MVEFGTSSAFMGWVRVRVLGYSFGVRGRKVNSRDCALASDLVRATAHAARPSGRFAEGRFTEDGKRPKDHRHEAPRVREILAQKFTCETP